MLKRSVLGAALAIAILAGAPLQSTPSVTLNIRNGRVWLTTDRATPAQILAEWARVGHTQVLGDKALNGAPLSLELQDVPEIEALEIVLRSSGGFMTAARTPDHGEPPNMSQFSRVVIVAASTAAGRAMPPPPPVAAAPMPVYPPAPAAPPPVVTVPGAQRVIGADGQPVPDDQDSAPPPPPKRPGGNLLR